MPPMPRNLESGRQPTTWELEEADSKPFGITSFVKTPGKKTSRAYTQLKPQIERVTLQVLLTDRT